MHEQVVIAVSLGCLFNIDMKGQMRAEDRDNPRPAYHFVKALNNCRSPDGDELFHILVTYTDNALKDKLETAIKNDRLSITAVLIQEGSILTDQLLANNTNLYLSDVEAEVKEMLRAGIPAATMYIPKNLKEVSETQLRVAFDGDGVLFSGESALVYEKKGLEEFNKHEEEHKDELMGQGPFKDFLGKLVMLQNIFQGKKCPIQTYLVTARGPGSCGIRALSTLRAWGMETNEALLLNGAKKGPMLEVIRPHIFFDDSLSIVEEALKMGISAAHVPAYSWKKKSSVEK